MSELNCGDRFGLLTVLCRDYELERQMRLKKSGQRYTPHKQYICRCDCGKTKTVSIYSLIRGLTRSCGCLKSKDLAGRTFGDLIVFGISENYKPASGKHKLWHCKCLCCGSTREVRSSDLLSGAVVDCGCRKPQRMGDGSARDLLGATFGFLTVIGRDKSSYGCGTHARWLCRCDLCGCVESVSSASLTHDGKDRCRLCSGLSLGETKIREILDTNGISYLHNKRFMDCIFPETNARLVFDFIVTNGNNTYMIEYDGEQHFKIVPQWENAINLDGRISRDRFKDKWCREHGYDIIRIPYTHLGKICIDDLIPDTSEFLVS